MEESVKLEKIKNSCEVGEKVTKVIFTIAVNSCEVGEKVTKVIFTIAVILCAVIIVVIGIVAKVGEDKLQEAVDKGHITVGDSIGSSNVISISVMDPANIHSDVQFVRDILDTKPYTTVVIISCVVALLVLIVMAVMMKVISSAFRTIRESENPFTDEVIHKVRTVMIVTSIVLFFTPGMVFGVMGLVLTWIVITIMDYGKTLQIQSDETL